MITKTSLNHASTLAKIGAAIRNALTSRKASQVHNRKGGAFLQVQYLTGYEAYTRLGALSGFLFLDSTGRDVTALVLSVLRAAN